MPIVPSAPARLDLYVRRGDTLRVPIVFQTNGSADDITGRAYFAEIRDTIDGTVIATITVNVISPTTGQAEIYLSKTITAALSTPTQRGGVWDLKETLTTGDPDLRTRIEGSVKFSSDVSHG